MVGFFFGGVCRGHLTKDDVKVYAAVLEKPGSHFPNASKWYSCVSSHLAKRFLLSNFNYFSFF